MNGVSSHKDEGNPDLSNCIQNETGQVLEHTMYTKQDTSKRPNQIMMIFLIH